MKHCLIHIGYPKTGTTSLQENLFLPLSRDNKINYIGHALADSRFTKSRSSFVQQILLGDINPGMHHCLARTNGSACEKMFDPLRFISGSEPVLSGLITDKLINVISFETLLMPFRSVVAPEELPERVKSAFDDGDTQFTIVCTLRPQIDLMESFYAEKARFMFRQICDDISRVFFEQDGHTLRANSQYVRVFNFHHQLNAWADVFGQSRLRLFLYSEIGRCPSAFRDFWAGELSISPDRVERALSAATRKRHLEKSRDRRIVRMSLEEAMLASPFWRRVLRSDQNTLPKAVAAILRRVKINRAVSAFSAKQKYAVTDFFRDSNTRCAHEFNLDLHSMKRDGYL